MGFPGRSWSTASAPRSTGRENRCFLPASQERTHRWLEGVQPGRHSLHVVPGYGHLDIFLGRNAARDVFPGMVAELARPT